MALLAIGWAAPAHGSLAEFNALLTRVNKELLTSIFSDMRPRTEDAPQHLIEALAAVSAAIYSCGSCLLLLPASTIEFKLCSQPLNRLRCHGAVWRFFNSRKAEQAEPVADTIPGSEVNMQLMKVQRTSSVLRSG